MADRVVAMCTLVEGQEAEEESRGAVGRRGTAVLPMNGGLVVAECHYGVTSKGQDVGEHLHVSHMPRDGNW